MSLPRYEMPASPRFMLGRTPVHLSKVVDFLTYVIERDRLTISDHLGAMGQEPFFLVAATGLGKTVAVPVHVLIRLMQSLGTSSGAVPRVWVVEPRIPIAVDQMKFMNSLWGEYLQARKERKLPPLFGCISSASGKVNRDAPIKFVTTGIFELMTRAGDLTPSQDRVIIDEAHVTIEQNPGVELGIALARKAGVPVDYMSATVDTAGLADDLGIDNIIRADTQRQVIWKHNLMRPLYDALPDIVRSVLVTPDPSSEYFPKNSFREARTVIDAVTSRGQSHGLLAVVNSFAGDHSDIRRLADVVRHSHPGLVVLELASEVVRDAKRSKEFERRLKAVEAAKQNYVVLATSVVEMGITFPSIDFVVTMDSGYEQETIGDVSFPVVAPLGVNSLLQRIGRVGRRRPGIAYISLEVGAEYSELEDEPLNRGVLKYEPIRFPMTRAPLMALAYYGCQQEWDDLGEWVTSLRLPSKLQADAERMEYLGEQIAMLEQLGLAQNHRLTELGRRMEQWIGQADLAYSVQLQKRFNEGAGLSELMFWVVATALSNTPLATLRAQHDFFVDYEDSHSAIAHEVDVWRGYEHEDMAAFAFVSLAATMAPRLLFAGNRADNWDRSELGRWCQQSGVDGRKLLKAGSAIADLWQLFCKINSSTETFKERFGGVAGADLECIAWSHLADDLDNDALHEQLLALPGVTHVEVFESEAGGLEWRDLKHGHAGRIGQDDTPIKLVTGNYAARLVPSRESKAAAASWRLAHLGTLRSRSRLTINLAKPATSTSPSAEKSRWGRLRGALLGR
ncbi:helicase-related protein [Kribbella sp. NPDC051620]|uniref:helicase-related protein n=1 Tax=Kribbella sp. NPDC051620 TaxID=3364120 RepID=UPI0037B609A2